jgi:membrane fusion protein (multidrug efflux system)
MRFPPIVIAGIYICLVMTACHSKKEVKAPSPTPIVDVIIATKQTVTSNIEVNGTIVANQFVELRPEVAGRIIYLNIREGQKVAKGTVIARTNSEDLEAQLNKSKAQLQLAILTEERLRKLLAINGVNQNDYDVALNQVHTVRADINYYTALIGKTVLRAPFTGVLGLRNVSVGAYVGNTDVLASLQQLDSLKIDFTVPDEYSSVIKKGNIVSITPNGTGQSKQKAIILATEPQVNTQTRNLRVRALMPNSAANIGSFAKVNLEAGENKNAILVPTSSIIPDDRSNKVVVIKGGKAIYTDVMTGIRQTNNIEVTSGLKEGDSVAVTGILFTRNKGAVKVRSVKVLADLNK